MRSTLGLALIAKDEEETLARLLASIEGAFDQVALLDTGSSDRTVEVFEDWAAAERERQPGFVSTLGHFEWCDDFAAARNAADELLETDWLCWADCDDEVLGANLLRQIVASLPSEATIAEMPYDYFPGAKEPLAYPRIARAGKVEWRGRVHEAWYCGPSGRAFRFVDELPRWKHRADVDWTHRERNLRILHRWIDDEPEDPTPYALLVAESAYVDDRDAVVSQASDLLERFGSQWSVEERETVAWVIEGIRLGIDLEWPELIARMDTLIHAIYHPVGTVGDQRLRARHRPRSSGPKTRQQRRAEARLKAKELGRSR